MGQSDERAWRGDVVLQKLNLDDQMGLKSMICA